MTKKDLKKIMERNMIMECEIGDVISFITELLEIQADETERDYPYVTRTIKELECAAHAVWSLQDYISELEEE